MLFPLLSSAALGATPVAPGDGWLEAAATVHWPLPASGTETNRFAALHAEVVSGQLQIVWPDERAPRPGGSVRVEYSADSPGHWPARDWQSVPMSRFGDVWKSAVPLDSVDVPLVYFVVETAGPVTNVSPARLALPRQLGLEHPSKFFWPFLEGFELGTRSWRSLDGQRIELSPLAKSGKSSLRVLLREGRTVASVGTTRLRGWFAQEHQSAGISVWAKTSGGSGQMRCSLMANAFTTNQVLVAQTNTTTVTSNWRRVNVPFTAFPALPLGDLDFVAFEFSGPAGTEFVLDDLTLLDRWQQ